MRNDEIKLFLEKYAQGINTEEEHQSFIDWLKTAPIADVEAIAEEYKSIAEKNFIKISSGTELTREIEAALDQWDLGAGARSKKAKVISIGGFRKIAAAAIIIGILFGGYWFLLRKTSNVNPVTVAQNNAQDVKAPTTNRAMITMANGKTVYLDSAANGILAQQGDVQLIKSADGQIAYTGSSKEVIYNTMTNPRGSKVIDMMLSDGSHVWLNAGSSVTFPVSFVGNERKISMTGEAYFEVTHDATKPFLVTKGETTVQVLGTHFNVNAYDDEESIKVTLLEGSVSINQNEKSKILKPGQQAQIAKEIKLVNDIDLEQVVAWKNGYFSFGNADLQTVMRQIARWYDVTVAYEGKVPDMHFGGDISRTSTAAQVLSILEKSKVRFRIEGQKITVLP